MGDDGGAKSKGQTDDVRVLYEKSLYKRCSEVSANDDGHRCDLLDLDEDGKHCVPEDPAKMLQLGHGVPINFEGY